MFDNILDDTLRAIDRWEPDEEKYSNENQYRNDLMKFLRQELNKQGLGFGTERRIKVTKEDGRGLCDIAINEKIGIEMKKDLIKQADIDRLIGQLKRFKRQYESLIVVLVGATDDEHTDMLKDEIRDLEDTGSFVKPDFKIEVVDKGYEIDEEGSEKESDEEYEEKPEKTVHDPFGWGDNPPI